VIKKLDKLIIKAFLGPFVVTFFIAFFVLMMQSLWKYIDDLVGKGLDLIIIAKFLWYISSTLLTLAIPIAILISSIMTFGNLGESFELVAIKSAGISLLRFMRPLLWIAIGLCGVSFLFANYVIPYANLKFATLYNDIYYTKPALDLKPGVFYTQIPGYAIKAGRKGADGKTLFDVVIYEQNNPLSDNCIIAEKGVMNVSGDKQFMEFNLENGCRYQERGFPADSNSEFIRLSFTSFKKLFDLSSLRVKTSDTFYKGNFKMLNVSQLDRSLVALKTNRDSIYRLLNREASYYLHYTDIPDSFWKSHAKPLARADSMDKLIPDSIRTFAYDIAINTANNLKGAVMNRSTDIENRSAEIRSNGIEWHRKFSLSLACLVLFFIGAPLGSIIRKGGLGMPLVVAIIFFLIFHLLNLFGEKFSKEAITPPYIGMWLAVMVLIPVGIFLTYKAMHDSNLFNKEFYYRFFNAVKRLFGKRQKEDPSNV
jgi:lipopolysaccharide export system permease protein